MLKSIYMKPALITLIVLVIIGGGYYWYTSKAPVEMPTQEGKLDINVVCEGALAYMTFEDGEAADRFVAECKAGEHPEVIERYKEERGYGDGAAI